MLNVAAALTAGIAFIAGRWATVNSEWREFLRRQITEVLDVVVFSEDENELNSRIEIAASTLGVLGSSQASLNDASARRLIYGMVVAHLVALSIAGIVGPSSPTSDATSWNVDLIAIWILLFVNVGLAIYAHLQLKSTRVLVDVEVERIRYIDLRAFDHLSKVGAEKQALESATRLAVLREVAMARDVPDRDLAALDIQAKHMVAKRLPK